MEECVFCGGVANYIKIDGGWYVCSECIKDGDAEADIRVEEANV